MQLRALLRFTDDCFIASNYKSIVAKVAEVPLAKATIRFGTVMTCVEAKSDKERTVCVRMSDGREEHFDEVVITTPLGWLKRHKQDIRPLSPRVSEAIDSMSFGRLEKVIPCPAILQADLTLPLRS